MSRPDQPLILSPRAEEDFSDILQYTVETWGETQAFEYRDLLDKVLAIIREHPQIGHGRPELSPARQLILNNGKPPR